MAADFIKDDTGIIWLVNISKLHYEALPVNTRSNHAYKETTGNFMKE